MSFGRPKTGTAPPAAGELALAAVGARVHVDVDVPGVNVRGAMRLLSRREEAQMRHEARAACAAQGLPWPAAEASQEFHGELMVRTVAVAVRAPANVELALAPLEDWLELTDLQLYPLWVRYQDLEAELDPMRGELTAEDLAAIAAAAKKKDAILLRSYGSRKLAAFAITTVGPPST